MARDQPFPTNGGRSAQDIQELGIGADGPGRGRLGKMRSSRIGLTKYKCTGKFNEET